MSFKVDKKIVGYRVLDDKNSKKDEPVAVEKKVADIVHMSETLERPEILIGSTYKLKTPLSDNALYVTINDVVLNEGTDHEQRRPFEIFINSKNMDHFQWIVALTRIMSAVFRKGGDIKFLVEELRSVFDPRGGYFKKGGKYMPSLVAEIGDCLESHLRSTGMIGGGDLDEHQKRFLDKKKSEVASAAEKLSADSDQGSEFPASAELCQKCNVKALVKMDGCKTCLNCADSKCG